MKKILLLGILAALILFPAAVFADNPLDTASGVLITAEGRFCTLSYTDSGSILKPTAEATTITIAVLPMYGFDGLTTTPTLQATTPGTARTYNYTITNEGNNSDTFGLKYTVTYTGCAGTGWLVEICRASDNFVLANTQNTIGVSPSVGEDANWGFYVRVTPSSVPTNAPNGSFATVTVTATTAARPAGEYYGANGITYGGTSEASNTTITTIETSVMTMTRVATVDAPRTAGGKYTGGAHDAVPGAVITYTITTSNEGSANALSVDKVPSNTWIAHVNEGTSWGTVPNVTITAPSPDATGWTAYYTTAASPNFTYGYIGGTQWVTIAAVGAVAPTDMTATSHTFDTYVKFEKAIVTATEDTRKLNWGVTIR
jgi:hypothetical protein